jgi:hypothetical protein
MPERDRVRELEDAIKQRDARIQELRDEIDEQRDLINRLREHADDYVNSIEAWKESFGMTMTEDGKWTWAPFWNGHGELIDAYNDLVRQWNKYLPRINGEPRNVGRPLAASEAQCVQVLKLHKGGVSLRAIVDETNLGLRTVRTIIDQKRGTDRTTRKHRGRIDPSGVVTTWKRQKRTGQYLPKRAQAVAEAGAELIKEAKGLGR